MVRALAEMDRYLLRDCMITVNYVSQASFRGADGHFGRRSITACIQESKHSVLGSSPSLFWNCPIARILSCTDPSD